MAPNASEDEKPRAAATCRARPGSDIWRFRRWRWEIYDSRIAYSIYFSGMAELD
ncbi:hypothetical protein ABIF97_003888 [Bradyrhizobium japonicum]